MSKIFLQLYDFFSGKKTFLLVTVIAFFLLSSFLALRVSFEEDITKMFPDSEELVEINTVFKNSRFTDKLIVAVSYKDSTVTPEPDSLIAYADRFVEMLNAQLSEYVEELKYKYEDDAFMSLYDSVLQQLPIYLEEADYEKIDSLISEKAISYKLKDNYKLLTSPAGAALKNTLTLDPLGFAALPLNKMSQLNFYDFQLYSGYFFSSDMEHLLLFVYPANPANETAKNEKLIKGIDEIIQQLSLQRFSVVSCDYFGPTAIAVGNARQLKRDTQVTLSITITLLMIFIGFFFKRKQIPFIMLLPVAFGVLFSLAIIYILQGSISTIAIGAGSVVLGIAVNYPLHIFSHYRHTGDMRQAVADLSKPMTTGIVTTVGAFLFLKFLKSEILQDFGLFAGLSLIGAALFSLILLPHLVPSLRTGIDNSQHTIVDRLSQLKPERNRYLIIAICILTAAFIGFMFNVRFEGNMLSLNYLTPELQQSERKINQLIESNANSVYLVSTGTTLDMALMQNESLGKKLDSLRNNDIIRNYTSVSSLLPSQSLQYERIQRWKVYWTNEKKEMLRKHLTEQGTKLKFRETAFSKFFILLEKDFTAKENSVELPYVKSMLNDYIVHSPDLSAIITPVQLNEENKKLVYGNFFQTKNIRILDKQVITQKFIEIVKSDFSRIAGFTSLLVFVALLFTYRSLLLAFITFIPMAISWIWILGIMGVTGLHFNLVNIILSTFIFGLGDDFSIFIIDGLINEHKQGKQNITSYKVSNYLAAITIMMSLGALIFAQHPALKSMAVISIIGMFCVLVISHTVIPFLFKISVGRNSRHTKESETTG